MKKNLLLRLCLIITVSFIIYSCRTDHLPEQETFNNSSAFQLTSKRISLSEAKHKSKLLPELEKAESKLKAFSKTNAQGKVVNYGNGVSIDADDVIYIENGSNYHTYTFHIKRDNILPDDPVENLVLSPMADGTYKEVLVSYHLTPSEKEILKNGGLVETKGKTIITELANGTYSPLAKGMTSCGWVETYTVMGCSDVHNGISTHNAGNVDTWEGCTADRKPGLYMTMTYRCDFSGMTDDMGNPINPGGSSGSSGGGISGGTGNNNDGPGNNTSPCPDGGTLTEPQGLNTDPGDGNCSGIPTQINLPDRTTPCKKTKASVTAADNLLKEQSISTEIQSLENHAANSFTEYGMAIINTGTTTIAQDPYSNNDPNNPGSVSITIPSVGDYIASAHTHPDHGAAPPSVKDFYIAFQNAKNYSTFQANYVFAHNGTKYAFVVNDRAKAEAFLAAYPFETNTIKMNGETKFNKSSVVGKDFNEIYESYKRGTFPNYSGDDQNDGLESAFAYILEKYDMGISLAKSDSNGNLNSLRSVSFEHTISSSGGKKVTAYKAQPCP